MVAVCTAGYLPWFRRNIVAAEDFSAEEIPVTDWVIVKHENHRANAHKVSIIVPCRNEVDYIRQFIASIRDQKLASHDLEVVIADGMSNDGTRETLTSLMQGDHRLRMIDNPKGIVSTGLNLAAQTAKGDILVRMDVHTHYAEDYVLQCVVALSSQDASCVGGPWKAAGKQPKQQAIADAFQSPLGSGGALSRRLDYTGPADTVYLGCWWRDEFLRFGGFDEALVRNQDDELSMRISNAGRRIWQSASIRSTYYPRSSFRLLFKQFFQYGYWKIAVLRKHGKHAAMRHQVPFAFVSSVMALFLLSPFFGMARVALSLILALYLLAVLVASITASSRGSITAILQVGVAIVLSHIGYGSGYALGIIDSLFRLSRQSVAKLSR